MSKILEYHWSDFDFHPLHKILTPPNDLQFSLFNEISIESSRVGRFTFNYELDFSDYSGIMRIYTTRRYHLYLVLKYCSIYDSHHSSESIELKDLEFIRDKLRSEGYN